MEVKLEKNYPILASVEQAWAVLCDIRATASCMPGAAIVEQIDETHFKGTVKSKVGPATMNFGGDIEVLSLDAPTHSMQMLGKGADRSGSSASMNLSSQIVPGATPGTSVLVGIATIVVSGKLAQFGSRLLVPVSEAILQQFAGNFQTAAQAVVLGASSPEAATPEAQQPVDHAQSEPVAGVPNDSSAPGAAGPLSHSDRVGLGTRDNATAVPLAVSGGSASAATPSAAGSAAPAPANELNALALIWIVIKGWFAGLFGKKS
jgi:carbon monoxide dehydrogenase subunit G